MKFFGIFSDGLEVVPSKPKAGANPSVKDPMTANAKRRRNGALSTRTSAHATTRISIPSCHPAASRSFRGARDTDDFRHQSIVKLRAVYGAIAAHSSRNSRLRKSCIRDVAQKQQFGSSSAAQTRSRRSRAPVSLTSRA